MYIDKLADYIPQESPFGYCMNNPILYIDRDYAGEKGYINDIIIIRYMCILLNS